MLTQNSFERLSDDIIEVAENVTLSILERLQKIARLLVDNPEANINRESIRREVEALWEQYFTQAQRWTDESLPEAYLKGIERANGETPDLEAQFGFRPEPLILLAAGFSGGGGTISPKAAEFLSEYPRHHTMYTAFQDAAYSQFQQTRLPVVRDVRGKLRDLIVMASEEAYKDADGFTRRKMTQRLMNKFADDNITGIQHADGRTMKLDTYSEVVARSQTGNAARQASLNRQQEQGLDLIQISQHFPTSDLCAPHQGRVYSISGTSSKYPSFESTNPGSELYHVNCYGSETKVMTGDGWKLIKDCDGTEKIMSLNPDSHEIEFVDIAKTIETKTDEMIEFSDGMDLRVTPNHRMYVASPGFDIGRFVEARYLVNTHTTHFTDVELNQSTAWGKIIESDETVYCLELEKNHIMFVKRNKTAWCGNCKHFQSPYIEGTSKLPEKELNTKENRERYEITQKQRYNERQIRSWRRREASAITDDARDKAKSKVREWQKRNKELVDQHDYLRRKYFREGI